MFSHISWEGKLPVFIFIIFLNTFFKLLCVWTVNSSCKVNKFYVEHISNNCRRIYCVVIFNNTVHICFHASFTCPFIRRLIEIFRFNHTIWKHKWKRGKFGFISCKTCFWPSIRSIVLLEAVGISLKRFNACLLLIAFSTLYLHHGFLRIFCIVLQNWIVQHYFPWILKTCQLLINVIIKIEHSQFAWRYFRINLYCIFISNERQNFCVPPISSEFIQENGIFTKVAEWSVKPASITLQSGLSKKGLWNTWSVRVAVSVVIRVAVVSRSVIPLHGNYFE